MKRNYLLLSLLCAGSIITNIFAQNESFPPTPNPFSAATSEPSKSVIVSNAIELVRQFEQFQSSTFKIGPVTSDYELEFYKEGTSDFVFSQGTSHNIRASYSKSTGDEKYKVTGSISERLILPGNGQLLFNHLLSLKGRRNFLLNDGFTISAGLGTNMLIYSKKIADLTTSYVNDANPLSGIFSLDVVSQKYFNANKLTAGFIVQQSVFNKSHSTDLGLSALWGMPAGSRLILKFDASYRLTILTLQKEYDYDYTTTPVIVIEKGYKRFDYHQDGASTPHSLSLGASGTVKMSDRFGLNIGYRTILLAENYTSHVITIGGRFAF